MVVSSVLSIVLVVPIRRLTLVATIETNEMVMLVVLAAVGASFSARTLACILAAEAVEVGSV